MSLRQFLIFFRQLRREYARIGLVPYFIIGDGGVSIGTIEKRNTEEH
jgi:hypothetical protein